MIVSFGLLIFDENSGLRRSRIDLPCMLPAHTHSPISTFRRANLPLILRIKLPLYNLFGTFIRATFISFQAGMSQILLDGSRARPRDRCGPCIDFFSTRCTEYVVLTEGGETHGDMMGGSRCSSRWLRQQGTQCDIGIEQWDGSPFRLGGIGRFKFEDVSTLQYTISSLPLRDATTCHSALIQPARMGHSTAA